MKYRAGYKYQLAEDYRIATGILPAEAIDTQWISLSNTGSLLVKKGYAWDGPSGPTLDSTSAMVPSLVHDALYQLIRLGHLGSVCQEPADDLFRNLCLDRKMWRLRAYFWHRAVRKHGHEALHSEPNPIEEVF